MLTLELPIPPSANALFKNVPQGGRAKTRAYTAWREAAGYVARMAVRGGHGVPVAPLQLVITAALPRTRDLGNPNQKAVEIAQRTLRSIVFAAGLQTCTDSEQLHMRRMLVSVKIEERNDKPGQMTNRIAGYKAAIGAAAANSNAAPPPPQQQRAAAGGGGSTPPWKR